MVEEDSVTRKQEEYLELLRQQLLHYLLRISRARYDSDVGEHIKRDRQVGNFWREIREEQGLTRDKLAQAMEMPEAVISVFEEGLFPVDDLPPRFVENLAISLNRPDAILDHVALMDDSEGRDSGAVV